MHAVRARIDEADSESIDLLTLERLCDAFQRALVQRKDDLAVRTDPFQHFKTQAPRYERIRLAIFAIVRARRPKAREFEHVAKTRGRHQRHLDALALDDGIGGDGRRVNEFGDTARVDLEFGE